MKKIISIIVILLVCIVALFAEEKTAAQIMAEEYSSTPAAYSSIASCFVPENARMLGMGGAGLAFSDSENGLFYNPAALAGGEFKLSLPTLSASVYHVYDILKEDLLGKIKGDRSQLVSSVLNVVGTQYAPLAKVDVAASMILPFGFGFGVYAGDTVSTYSGTVVDELDASVVAGYGTSVYLGNIRIAGGVTAEFNALVFNKRAKIADVMKAEDIYSTELTLASGWNGKLPVLDCGLTVELAGLSASVVVSNILEAEYDMTVSSSAIKELGFESIKNDIFSETSDFKVSSSRVISAGIAGDFSGGEFEIRFALDCNDIDGFVKSLSDVSLDKKRVIIGHLNAGLEISLASIVTARVGFNSGYWTAGASLQMGSVMRIDCAYYWTEMGSYAGSRGLDGLTVRFNLGCE